MKGCIGRFVRWEGGRERVGRVLKLCILWRKSGMLHLMHG